jgi:UDP-N-acetylglucosamine/UDP-N-acetylgalactosamine diphosphorylase
MHTSQLLSHLAQLGKKHLLAGYAELASSQQARFAQEVLTLSGELLRCQRELLLSPSRSSASFEPISHVHRAGSEEDRRKGEQLIQEGKVACLILAGGQGSRLGTNGPKGAVPVSLIRRKSLFQLFAERTHSASLRAGRPLHLAIMTSPLNHAATLEFFDSHHRFGLPTSHLHFFSQGTLPFCDDRGNWLLERPGKLAVGPDGNGNALHLLNQTGLSEKWRSEGIEYVNVILVDNPLADPFDPELIGFHHRMQADVVVKAVPRLSAEEKMGIVVSCNGRTSVVEYSELHESDRLSLNSDGTPRFSIANTSLFSFSLDFIEKIADPLPLHLARKQAPVWLSTAQGSCTELAQVWKYETFIFDVLPLASRVETLLYPRDLSYAPLKNASGEKSLKTVQEALLAFDRYTYSTLSGLPSPDDPFELHPCFYYPTSELMEQWRGKALPPTSYVEKDA